MKVEIIEHAKLRMAERGATESDVRETVRGGVPTKAKSGRRAKEKVFRYDKPWQGQAYPQKKLKVVYAKEGDVLVVITVYYGEWEE